ncbi:Uncharacterised protein [Dermatophilus congolensis]|uniref:Uncharacterized protein n=1 Tax=Dermatophilus congolensis TaxID=1863 RepID=A0AA46BP07_9MICO|nr:Uncharacterised protein [Dermatophilus congolensis]
MVSLWRRQGRWLASPVRLVPIAFILFMALGAALLALPISHPGEVDYLASATGRKGGDGMRGHPRKRYTPCTPRRICG